MASCPIVEPPWTVDLPRLGPGPGNERSPSWRQLPGAAGAYPGATTNHDTRAIALGLRRRCWACGCALRQNRPVYNVMNYSPDGAVPWERHPGDVFANSAPGPLHKSCAYFTCLVCPFLLYPTSRARAEHKAGDRRGDAEIIGFHKYGRAYYDKKTRWGTLDLWGYCDVAERIPFVTWKDLLPFYDQVVAADAEVIDTSTRLYWSDSPTDTYRLRECSRADELKLKMLRGSAFTRTNGYWYRLALL
jgi:hypothetical protein